jgi:hypothetical protein
MTRMHFICLNGAALLLGQWLSGCSGGASAPEASPVETAETVATPVEPVVAEATWEEQLARVRSGESSQVRLSGPVTPEQWAHLATGCEGLMVLDLPMAEITDEQLALLPALVSLRQLVLGGPTGDAGLATLAQCPSLEIVNLPKAGFSDAGLAKLKDLPLLTLLRFGSPQVTDAGMEHLAEMPNLRFLHLLNVPVTDAGMEPLKRCSLLESFYIDGGRCSDEGLACLLKAHPGLHLHVNQLHLAGDEHTHDHAQ